MQKLNLVLYSGGQQHANKQLHEALSDLAGMKNDKSFTYIPYCDDGHKVFYNRAKKRYSRFGFNKFHCLPVDQKISKPDLERALTSDVIYLAGGNTFYFLHHLKKQRLLGKFKKFAENGGVMAGLSAGALIMTPNIQLANYPWFDKDPNEVGLTNLNGMGLTEFEFFPHYHFKDHRLVKALESYSKKSKTPIIASHDGGGIVFENNATTFMGRHYLFAGGVHLKI